MLLFFAAPFVYLAFAASMSHSLPPVDYKAIGEQSRATAAMSSASSARPDESPEE